MKRLLLVASIAAALISACGGGEGEPALIERMVGNLVENDIRHNLPDGWFSVKTGIVGGSAATPVTASMAANRAVGNTGGVVFFSPLRPSSQVELIRYRALVIYHSGDTGVFGNAMFNALTSSIARERIALSGGADAGCGFHLFNGLDAPNSVPARWWRSSAPPAPASRHWRAACLASGPTCRARCCTTAKDEKVTSVKI